MTKRRRYAILLAATCVAGVAASQLGAHGADVSSDALIHADASRALGYTGTGVTVAVIDTGIDDHNPELANAVVAEHCFVPPDGCPDGTAEQDGPGSAQDDQGHGTAIADIIAGKGVTGPVGIVPDASLVVVKVADRNGRTSAAQIVAGLNWVRTQHPEAKVVNVSLGSDLMLSGDCTGLTASLTAYGAAIDALRAQGATVFASSGNGRLAGIDDGAGLHPCCTGRCRVFARLRPVHGALRVQRREDGTRPDRVLLGQQHRARAARGRRAG